MKNFQKSTVRKVTKRRFQRMNFPHLEQNGILKHLYRKNNTYYNDTRIFSYNSSGFEKRFYTFAYHAFDFDSSNY